MNFELFVKSAEHEICFNNYAKRAWKRKLKHHSVRRNKFHWFQSEFHEVCGALIIQDRLRNSSRWWLIEISHSLSNFTTRKAKNERKFCRMVREHFSGWREARPRSIPCLLSPWKLKVFLIWYTFFVPLMALVVKREWKNISAAINDYLLSTQKRRAEEIYHSIVKSIVAQLKMG